MKNPWVYKHLVKWMEKNHLSKDTIHAFASRWQTLGDNDSILCPACFAEDEEEHLVAEKVRGEVELLFCVECKNEFEIPIPN